MSATYKVAVLDQTRCGADVVMMRLERPRDYAFAPGQWLRLTLETRDGEETKTFSNAAARGDDWLELATRLSGSAFKDALAALEPGDPVGLLGPGGRLSLPDAADRVAFLIGGVGVTPARGILRDAVQRGHVFADALVIYGNRDQTCVPYLEELRAMRSIGVRVVPVYERPDADWTGDRGFITAETVRRQLDTADGRPFFVSGPPVMVAAIKTVLDELGIAEDRRRIEWFGSPQG